MEKQGCLELNGGGGVIKMVSAPDDRTHQDDNSINIFSSCFTVTVKGLHNCVVMTECVGI